MYPILRSLDPHHARIGYVGALATVATRGLDSVAGLAARFQDLLFEKIYADDPRLEAFLSRVDPTRREQLRHMKARSPEEDPSAILAGPSPRARWFYVSELWLQDARMPSSLGFLKRDQVERTIDLARWIGILLPTLELSEVGFLLQRLLGETAAGAQDGAPFNLLDPQARPCLPLLYIRQLLLAEMLFPFLVSQLVERDTSGKVLATRGEDGLLRASVDRMLAAIGEPTDPADMLEVRDVSKFRSSIEGSLSTEENYLRPRMEILVDLRVVGRKGTGGRLDFMWAVTETTRRLADEWRPLASAPNKVPEYADQRFFRSMAEVFATDHRSASSDEERLLWFARAFRVIGRDFGFTPGRALALLACLLAWEAGTVIEIGDIFAAVYAAAKSEWARFLHFSGGSRFDQEFLIRLDDEAVPALERAVARSGSAA
jgi:hypothetical protein